MSSLRATVRRVVEGAAVRLPPRSGAGDRLVLAYHNIVPPDRDAAGDRSLHLTAERFDQQLRLLRDESDVVPLTELLVSRKDRRTRLTAVTFDDAYQSALQLGLPLCASHDVSATVFVAPGLLGSFPPWDEAAECGRWTDEDRKRFLWSEQGLQEFSGWVGPAQLRIATEQELRSAIYGSSHTIGNHTFSHPNLGALTTEDAVKDIRKAHQWLEGFLPEAAIPVLAFPYGISPPDFRIDEIAHGPRYAFSVTGGWLRTGQLPNRSSMPRWNVPAELSGPGFRARLRGWFERR